MNRAQHGKDPVSSHLISDGSLSKPHHFSSQIFPPHVIEAAKRYRFDEELKNNPIEYQKTYEELKVEAALLMIVGASVPLA